jgi:hypothetical protein
MFPCPLVGAVFVQERVDGQSEDCASQPDIPALNALAMRALISLFEEKEGLFSRGITLTKDGFQREGTSQKQTIIALLGLQRLAEFTGIQPFSVASIRNAVLSDKSWIKSAGDLGLLTWFTAECEPEKLERLFNEFHFEEALKFYSDGRQCRTNGLAWFLAGIAHAQLACPGIRPDLTDLAVDAYQLLQDNQGEGGIFGHAAYPTYSWQTFCNRFGTFSDQIFAIYALTTFARAFEIEEPLGSALNCANSVRALQGDMGQWWFLYDKCKCRVIKRYPVVSMHQDGIAPLGLLAIEQATGQSFLESIYKGLSWVAGANELGDDLRNVHKGLIWDSIDRKSRMANYWEAALGALSISRGARRTNLRIRNEARPDHFGWLLYAFGSSGLPKAETAGVAAKAS